MPHTTRASNQRGHVQDFAQGVIDAYQRRQEQDYRNSEATLPSKPLTRTSKSYKNVQSRYMQSENEKDSEGPSRVKQQRREAPSPPSSPGFSKGPPKQAPAAERAGTSKSKSGDVPKLRYRRVQEMIKEHTVKNQESQLDREVKDNLNKITKLYKMKNLKASRNEIDPPLQPSKQGSEARSSDIHKVLPASTSSKKYMTQVMKPSYHESINSTITKPK